MTIVHANFRQTLKFLHSEITTASDIWQKIFFLSQESPINYGRSVPDLEQLAHAYTHNAMYYNLYPLFRIII